jgi:UDP-GlcNAc:undecaprenyl-phosphate GlcNAc-1-phosphate transferase
MWTWVLPLGCAFLLAAWLTALLVRIAPKRGWVAKPRQDRWNVRVVAQFGGIPILLAFLATAAYFFHTRQNLLLLLLTLGMGLLGFADDVNGLGPKAKLAGQTLLACLAVSAGIVHPLTSHFWINAAFTMFWIVGITNALNLLDNMDGLAGGIAIIAAAQVALLAGISNPISGLAFCMLAAISGFLIFNINPARVFMGDVGALSIGFFLGCASVKTAEHLSSLGSVLFVPSLVLFIPIFDTFLVSVTRRVKGRPISQGARDHASHRLVLIGLSERRAVSLLYVIAAVAGVMAFLWKSSWGDLGAGIVALFLIGSALFWLYLARIDLPPSWLSPGGARIISIPDYLQELIAGAVYIVVDAVAISLGLYFAYLVKFERLDRALFGSFLFAAALSLAIKLPLLTIFTATEHQWRIRQRRDVYPVLKAVFLAACLLTAVSVALPASKVIPSSIILLDAMFTCWLLILCRASSRIFDDLFGNLKRLASRPGQYRVHEHASVAPAGELAREQNPARDREMDRRPN